MKMTKELTIEDLMTHFEFKVDGSNRLKNGIKTNLYELSRKYKTLMEKIKKLSNGAENQIFDLKNDFYYLVLSCDKPVISRDAVTTKENKSTFMR